MRTKLLLMLLAILFVAGLAQANMIKNPGFEDGDLLLNNDNPDYWIPNATSSAMHSWVDDPAEAHSGSKYVILKNWTGGAYTSGLINEGVAVTEGEEYSFSVWAKCSTEDESVQAFGYYEWFDPCSISLDSGDLGGDVVSDEWAFVDCGSLIAPEGAVTCEFSIWSYTENEYKKVMFDDADMRIASVSNPDPAGDRFKDFYGDGAGQDEAIITWTNMEPNLLAPDPNVYVDVWFGTEPNNSANAKWVRVIDANLPEGLNATTYTAYVPPLNAPAPTPYYWKVVSYPNGATGIDPNNSVESLTYEFTSLSEQPAIVVIDTNDMITWIGKPVSINVTITDDGDSPVTLLWTADSTTGVTFDPNEHVEDPIVTITSGTYANALIKNPSFEGGLTDWESVGDGTSETWNGVYYGNIHINPSDGGAIGSIYTGLDVSDSGLSQTLSEPLAAETDYTLTVDVANDGYNGDAVVYYKIQLLAGETVIAEDYSGEYLPLPLYYPADWETSTVEHTSGTAGTDPNVGQSMEIRLLVTSDSTGLTFDNVNLTADPEFPTLSGHTYTLMLTATDNVGSKKDTIEIDVYDTSCQAARIGLSKAAENLGDLDGDCDTDIDDVAAMVLDWLDDTLPTEAIAIP